MTAKTQILFIGGEKPFGLGKMRGMAAAATPSLTDGLVFDLSVRHPLANLIVAIEAEIRHLFLENERLTGSMRIVTIGTRVILYRRVDNGCGLQLPSEILVTI